MPRTVLITILALLLLVGGLSLWVLRARARVFALPHNSPAACQMPAPGDVRTVVLLGDSLTHGTVSHNYVDLLEARFAGRPFRFVNAGVNSHLAYNLNQRLDEILNCRPDIAVILIGTNDVNALVSEEKLRSYMKEQQLPRQPDLTFYRAELTAIVKRLRRESKARVAVLSLPPIGEALNSAANQNVVRYSEAAREVARAHGADYLPLREAFWAALTRAQAEKGQKERKAMDCSGGKYPIMGAVSRHYLFGQSWDSIAERHGFHLLTDCLHLNSRGASLLADMVARFIESPHP